MVLLDKRSLKLDSVQDFEWSPKDDILCAYQSEQAGGNLPARISLIKLPERTELRQKNLFSVSGETAALPSSQCCHVIVSTFCADVLASPQHASILLLTKAAFQQLRLQQRPRSSSRRYPATCSTASTLLL